MTTLTIEPLRRNVLGNLSRGSIYEFLDQADTYLAKYPEDSEIRLRAIREYLNLGLVLPAQNLVATGDTYLSRSAECRAIVTSVQKLEGPTVPWLNLGKTFLANLEVLGARGVDTDLIRTAWNSSSANFQLLRDKADMLHVRRLHDDGRWMWYPFLGDLRAIDHARPLPEDFKSIMHGPYLFEGLFPGWYFKRLFSATRESFLGFSCALYVVEPDPAALALVLHLQDWREIWSDERVFLFSGEKCHEQFTTLIQENANLALPSWTCTQNAGLPDNSPSTVDQIEKLYEDRKSAIRNSGRANDEQYRHRNAAYWARRFDEALSGRGAPLRILSSVSRHTTFLKHSMRDAKKALGELGHRCVVLTESTDFEVISPLTYHRTIQDLDPDLFLAPDHLRPEFGDLVPEHLPIMTWDQDMLPGVFDPERIRAMSPLDVIVGLPHHDSLVRAGRDPRQALFARMPTSPSEFDTEGVSDREIDSCRCDVSYVSHASQTAEAFHQEQMETTANADVRRVMIALYPIARNAYLPGAVNPQPHYLDMLALAEKQSGITIRDKNARDHLVKWYLWRLCDRTFRHQALEWAGRWADDRGRSLRIFGNGWKDHPTLGRYAAGAVENGRDLALLYRASTINLQLMPAGFTHQRALDGLAAGGFFLTRETTGDRRDPRLNSVVERLSESGIKTGARMLECGDETLIRDVLSCICDEYSKVPERVDECLRRVLFHATVDYPAEVFPQFEKIVFQDQASFSDRADYFLANSSHRERIAYAMRQAVLCHYTYPKTLTRFLHFAAEYFRSIADGNCAG